jgi:uncharacterized protein (DUF2062 family)
LVFKRRDRKPVLRAVWELVWPKGGWGRAAQYVRHRVSRLPDPPERIARGIWAGVFTTFTPFYGFHFFIAAGLAFAMRGNIVAALLSTFFGNPLTYVPIGVAALTMGHWLMGSELKLDVEASLGEKFGHAASELFTNLWTYGAGGERDWSELTLFWNDVFYPYMIGGLLPGILTATICYYVSLPLIRAYQKRRRGVLRARFDALKAKAANAKAKKAADDAGPAE